MSPTAGGVRVANRSTGTPHRDPAPPLPDTVAGSAAVPAIVSVPIDQTPARDRALAVAWRLAAQLTATVEPVSVVRPGERATATRQLDQQGGGLVIESLAVVPTLSDLARRPNRLLCVATGSDPARDALAVGLARVAAPVLFVGPSVPDRAYPPIRRLLLLPGTWLGAAAARWIDRLASRLAAEVNPAPSARRVWQTRDRSAILVGRVHDGSHGPGPLEFLRACPVPWLALPLQD